MWFAFMSASILATTVHAYAPIQWTASSASGYFLMPKGFTGRPNGVALPQDLTVGNIGEDLAPSFTANLDKTITWNGMGWCLEAGGDKDGNAVRINYCTAGPAQKWNWVPDGHGNNMIQLEGTNMCIVGADMTYGSAGTSIKLRDCDSSTSDLWKFEKPVPGRANMLFTSHLRYGIVTLIALVGVGALPLSVWLLWRKAIAHAVPTNEHGAPLNVDQEGDVSLTMHGCGFRASRRAPLVSLSAVGNGDLVSLDERIGSATKLLQSAAVTKAEDSNAVVGALLDLEKDMRAKAKDDPETANEMLKNLDGAWRLIFTTGTIDAQKKMGRINYFPIKAVQTFDTQNMAVTNGIYLGDFALLKFFGPFTFDLKKRKLEFDFYEVAVLGFKIDLGRAGAAAEIGSATGLGSSNNKQLVEKGKKPFFNWVSADREIATARGGGGGLALWKRDTETEK